MELLADDVKGLLDGLNIKEACIIGESMGCFVSMEFALKYPETTKFLILTCGAAADNTHVGAIMLLDSWIEHFKEDGGAFYEKDVPLIACKNCRKMDAAKGIFDKYQTLLQTYPQNPIIRVFEGIKKFNARDRLKQISCPTLIIHGKRDKLIPLPFVQETHELIKNSELEILNGCHFALVHEHERFNEIVLNFLKLHGG